MKYYAVAVLAAALVCAASVGQTRPKTHPAKSKVVQAEPTIVKQEPGGAVDRVFITIKNPLAKAVWVYIECPNVLTIEPIGVEAHHTSKLNLLCPDGPGGPCRINHWVFQGKGAPTPWLP